MFCTHFHTLFCIDSQDIQYSQWKNGKFNPIPLDKVCIKTSQHMYWILILTKTLFANDCSCFQIFYNLLVSSPDCSTALALDILKAIFTKDEWLWKLSSKGSFVKNWIRTIMRVEVVVSKHCIHMAFHNNESKLSQISEIMAWSFFRW